MVLAAGEHPCERSRDAMRALCAAYWSPLFQYVRRQISDPQEAEDLTQDFFRHLLEKKVVTQATPERGRFRSYLLTSLNNYLKNEWERRSAEKRGGGKTFVPIDSAQLKEATPVDRELSPEQAYERQWAVTLLNRALDVLQSELNEAGKSAMFDTLKPYLTQAADAPSYAAVATELGISEGAVKAAVHRLRKRFRQIVRGEVSQTVSSPADIDDEITHLFRSLLGH